MNAATVDEARAVRSGEELDIAAVDAWLKQALPDLQGTPQVTQYAGGASNCAKGSSSPHAGIQ